MPRILAKRQRSSVGPSGADASANMSVTAILGPDVPPVRNTPTSLARRFYQICMAMIADSVAPAGLTPLQFAVLSYLNKENGEPGIDQNGLAARLGVDRNNASLLVEQLAQIGLLSRRVSEDDRRARLLGLTSKGERLYVKFRAANVEANSRILDPLTPTERKLLLDMLARIVTRNAAFARPGAGRRKPKRAKLAPQEDKS